MGKTSVLETKIQPNAPSFKAMLPHVLNTQNCPENNVGIFLKIIQIVLQTHIVPTGSFL